MWLLDQTSMSRDELEIAIFQQLEGLTTDGQTLDGVMLSKVVEEVMEVIPYKLPTQVDMVHEFHQRMVIKIEDEPTMPSENTAELRFNLIFEELLELAQAMGVMQHVKIHLTDTIRRINKGERKDKKSLIEILDALCDLTYVINGTIVSIGLETVFVDAFEEIHRSNMTKVCHGEKETHETIKELIEKTGDNYSIIKVGRSDFVIQRTRDNKIMKSKYYSPANLIPYIEGYRDMV